MVLVPSIWRGRTWFRAKPDNLFLALFCMKFSRWGLYSGRLTNLLSASMILVMWIVDDSGPLIFIETLVDGTRTQNRMMFNPNWILGLRLLRTNSGHRFPTRTDACCRKLSKDGVISSKSWRGVLSRYWVVLIGNFSAFTWYNRRNSSSCNWLLPFFNFIPALVQTKEFQSKWQKWI